MADIARGLGASSSAGPGSEADPFGDRFSAGHVDDRFGTPSLQSRSMTARDALLGSSFSLTGQRDGAGGSLAFWGRASQGSFDGAERGDGTDITLDGEVTTGMLGADYARGNWLVGLALMQSSSEDGFAAEGNVDPCPDTEDALCDGAVRTGDGDVEASLTAAIPYAALQASESLKLWGAAGYGSGEVTLKTTLGESYSADTSWTMAAAGAQRPSGAAGGGFRSRARVDLGRALGADDVGEDARSGGVGFQRRPAPARPGGQLPLGAGWRRSSDAEAGVGRAP